MEIINQIGTQTNIFSEPERNKSNSLDKQAFLNLLTAQLKYQDPMEPMENTEFVAQLSQFSSLEQLYNVNENLKAQAINSMSLQNTLVTSLIGKQVKAYGNTFELSENKEGALAYEIPTKADVTIKIYNGTDVVKTVSLGSQKAGENTYEWDGKGDYGNDFPPGTYTFEVIATDDSGNQISATPLVIGKVRGVGYENGVPILLIGSIRMSPSDIIEILDTGNA